jgi:hypothetical protein
MRLSQQQMEAAIIRMFRVPKLNEACKRIRAVRAFARRYGTNAAARLLDEIDVIAYHKSRQWVFDTERPWHLEDAEPAPKTEGVAPIIEDEIGEQQAA